MSTINPLLQQFDLHQRLYNNALEGFTDDETNRRISGYPQVNHIKYIAGHLLNSQYGIARVAGLQPRIKWNERFAVMGQSKAVDDIQYPDIREIIGEWNTLYHPVRNGLAGLSETELAGPAPEPFQEVAGSTGELWSFITHHQAYHIGQIALMRRFFGKEAMSYE